MVFPELSLPDWLYGLVLLCGYWINETNSLPYKHVGFHSTVWSKYFSFKLMFRPSLHGWTLNMAFGSVTTDLHRWIVSLRETCFASQPDIYFIYLYFLGVASSLGLTHDPTSRIRFCDQRTIIKWLHYVKRVLRISLTPHWLDLKHGPPSRICFSN